MNKGPQTRRRFKWGVHYHPNETPARLAVNAKIRERQTEIFEDRVKKVPRTKLDGAALRRARQSQRDKILVKIR